MPEFTVYVSNIAEEAITIHDAEDYEDAINQAFEQRWDSPSISNKFEFGGEAWCSGVVRDGTVVYEGEDGP